MNSNLKIRPAQASDAPFAASMIALSLHELADHLFQQHTNVIERMIAQLFARNAGRFGYKHTYIVEYETEPIGLLVVHRGEDVDRLNLETIFPLIAVLGFTKAIGFIYRGIKLPGGKEAEDDEFFLSNLGILPSMQGRSFGTQLLAYAEELAHASGLKKCSLIVNWHNTNAKRLYERIGYQVVEAVQDENEHLGYYRMVKVL